MRTTTGPIVVALSLTVFLPAVSASDAPPKVAEQARAVLRDRCYRCHGEDGRAENGFNFVLDVPKLVARNKVVPGDPAHSRLYKKIASGDMPPPDDGGKSLPRLGAAEKAAVEQWIRAGAPDFNPQVARRPFLSPEDVFAAMRADLQRLDRFDRQFTRYFTLTHLHNAGLSDNQLETYRLALSKLVNSLSWGRHVVVPKAIDPDRTILRIDLRDYLWNERIWDRIESADPYAIDYPTGSARACSTLTGCRQPAVRADWFVAAASTPPLYHDVLQLPSTEKDLEGKLQIDLDEDLRQRRAVRAGFSNSGVSQNNRVIERHESDFTDGAYWRTYDFSSSSGDADIFEHPLGPNDVNGFRHAGGEIIFSLPNGLQGYLLVDARGNRLDKGLSTIVSDPKRPDRAVVDGLSCLSCHVQGVIRKEDQVRPHVLDNRRAYPPDDVETILGLYGPQAKLDRFFKEDAERYARAVARTGGKLDGQGRVVGSDPVSSLVLLFEQELDLDLAAAEVGLRPEEFVKLVDQSPDLERALGRLKAKGTVKRDAFVAVFPELVEQLRLTPDKAPAALTSGRLPVPDALVTNDPLAGQARNVADLNVTEVGLKAADLVPSLCWSADGRDFFCLERDGVLRRVALDGFREKKRIDLGRKCGWLALSAEGLLVSLTDLQEVWVVDEASLRVKKRIPVPSVSRAVSSPNLSVAFSGLSAPPSGSLSVIDLKREAVVQQYTGRDFPNTGFSLATVTPDGKYLFTLGMEQLHRFRITGSEVVFEESSQRIAQGRLQDICVSPDSAFVCLPSGGGNYPRLENHPNVGLYSTYIYPVTNLNRPEVTLEQGAYPLAVGFDPRGQALYTQNFSFNLIVFSSTGIKQKEYKVGDDHDVRQYLVHPDGRKLLLLTSSHLYWVELPRK